MRVRFTVIGRPRLDLSVDQGRWSGKPVRIRRGPATVTGDALRMRLYAAASHWTRGGDREGAEGWAREPGDQPPTTKPKALVERGGSLKKLRAAGLIAGLVSLSAAASAAAAPVTVNLRVEGAD